MKETRVGGVEPRKPTFKGPAEWFTGDVWIDNIVQADDHSTLNVGVVHFTPGSRIAWHSHEGGQTLYVTEGRGLVQLRGEDIIELRPGDVHRTLGGHEHWHGADHEHFMTHISLTGTPTTWGDHVTDTEYGAGT
jgi:quercetin dioxygenase-like cupin family protein